MHLLGYGLDNLSLMALTVATGFVVDDAIVMIENVVRYIEQGVPPLEAAYRGAGQIGFTIVSLTVSLIAVFIPLLFMTGVVGRLFKEFSVTLSVAVVVSAVVSLTLTPMMCGRLLRPARGANIPAASRASARRRSTRLLAGYRRSLDWTLRHQTSGAAGRRGDAGRHGRALHRRAQGVPAAAGHRRDLAVTEAAQSASIPRLLALQTEAAARIARGPGGDRRGVVRRRRHDQRHAEQRAPDHRAEAGAGSATRRRW